MSITFISLTTTVRTGFRTKILFAMRYLIGVVNVRQRKGIPVGAE